MWMVYSSINPTCVTSLPACHDPLCVDDRGWYPYQVFFFHEKDIGLCGDGNIWCAINSEYEDQLEVMEASVSAPSICCMSADQLKQEMNVWDMDILFKARPGITCIYHT